MKKTYKPDKEVRIAIYSCLVDIRNLTKKGIELTMDDLKEREDFIMSKIEEVINKEYERSK